MLWKHFEHLRIPLKIIKSATNNFSTTKVIGQGGFGKIYKGQLSQGKRLNTTMVAVKRFDGPFAQGEPEFLKEVMILSCYEHENLVSLVGFCYEDREKNIVYEYVCNKSLDLYLSSTDLSWNQRLHICIGAARGIDYLHNPDGGLSRVLHRDIKSSNILLDQNWNAKIADFGLPKLGLPAHQDTVIMDNAVGTMDYIDPMYMATGVLSKESDVYSFGVVLFEVLCGRICIRDTQDNRSLKNLVS